MMSTASLTMTTIIDLATVTSPYSGSTSSNADGISGNCGSGPEQGFSYVLAPGYRIVITQTSNHFDSMHTLRHGGQYPGEVSVDCVDDPDESQMEFTNEELSDVKVYFIVSSSSSGEAGAFTLEWWFYIVGKNRDKKNETNLWSNPRHKQGRILNVYTPLTDSNIKNAAELWLSNQASATLTYGPIQTWDVSKVTKMIKSKSRRKVENDLS
jgi:hypothetical protein